MKNLWVKTSINGWAIFSQACWVAFDFCADTLGGESLGEGGR